MATKLRRPSLSAKRVERCRLIHRLNQELEAGRQITLVSAPAGFGKTTCVTEWVDTLTCPVTWLSLDAADDDPGRFFTYLVAALQKVDECLGREIVGVLRAGQVPPPEVIQASLGNDILEWDEPFLLVLDDFHLIQDTAILQLCEHLMVNPPPALRLVLITREDPPLPLARLRANNRLTEIRVQDLRFTASEASLFLNEVMELSLSQANISVLGEKTEGWIVGLQLAAIAMRSPRVPQPAQPGLAARDGSDPSSFIANLSGSHRFILSYLTEEVLSQRSQEIHDFLLQTSILDRLNGDLCNAVTGRSDGQAMLERLFNANLFLVPLDDEGQWYRYHHLFADLLQDLLHSLRKEKAAELHRRASHWYARHVLPGEAIRHALAAEEYATVVDLLERHALDMIMQGYAKTVNGWVQAVPAEWASSSPRTNLAFAWMHLLRGAYAEAGPYLAQVQAAFVDAPAGPRIGAKERAIKAEWLVMQSLLENSHGKATESLALATEALEIAPEDDCRVQSLAYFGQACAYQAMEAHERLVERYRLAIEHARKADNLIVEMMSTSALAQLAFEHGQLHLAYEIAAPACDRLDQSGSPPPIGTVVYGMLGEVNIQWLQLEPAHRYTQRALQLSTLGGYNSGIINCRVLLSRLCQFEGNLEGAAQQIRAAVDRMQMDTPEYVRHEAIAQQVRVYLAQDRPTAAEMILQEQGFSFQNGFCFPALPPVQSISQSTQSIGLLYNSSLHVLLYRARIRGERAGLASGIDLAGQLIDRALRSQTLLVALEGLLLRAQMRAELANSQARWAAPLAECRADYLAALERAEPEGILGIIVQQGASVGEALAGMRDHNQLGAIQGSYVARLLGAFSGSRPEGGIRDAQPASGRSGRPHPELRVEYPSLIEPLTDRELEVLSLMAKGLKYKEIAARLFISLNTVRFHVKAIYGKLSVNNRTRAVQRARELRIL